MSDLVKRLREPTFHAHSQRDEAANRIAALEAALSELITYAQACAMASSDPGTGVLSAISNANRVLLQH